MFKAMNKALLSVAFAGALVVSAFGAGGKTTGWSSDILAMLFNATATANVMINATSSPLTNLYVSLHTADPGVGGNCTTNEATYTSYARVAVARTTGGWTVTSGSVSPAATIQFPAATGGSETETYFGVCSVTSGTGVLYYRGPITPNIAVSSGVTPQLTTATAITED
jgi:hypothetical protein